MKCEIRIMKLNHNHKHKKNSNSNSCRTLQTRCKEEMENVSDGLDHSHSLIHLFVLFLLLVQLFTNNNNNIRPQLYVNGEFIGGTDIVTQMHESGELKELLEEIKAAEEQKE